jgi:hypothetical protein
VAKIGFEVGPLVDGAADGFAELAFGQDGTTEGEFVDGFLEPLVDHAAFGGTHGLAQGGAGLGFAQAFLDVMGLGELTQDPGDEPRGLPGGFEKSAGSIPCNSNFFRVFFVFRVFPSSPLG